MQFSIVIPVYNVADYLEKCVDSVLANDCTDTEILLVDDGSTDGKSGPLCDAIAAAHPELITVIHQQNQGLGGARNTGLERAKGEYLLFIDSDDYISADTLATLRRALAEQPADMVIFSFQYTTDTGLLPAEPNSLPKNRVLTLRENPELLICNPAAWLRIWRRELFTSTGIRFPHRVWYEDLHTTGKCLCHAKSVVVLDAPLYFYVLRQGSIMRNSNTLRNLEILDALEDLRSYLTQQNLLESCGAYLEYLALDSVVLAAQRVLLVDPKADFLPDFLGYLEKTYPNYGKNPHIGLLGRKKRLLLRLLEARQYGLLNKGYRLLHRLRGK